MSLNMTTCVFRYCKNTSRNVSKSSDISFHRFVHSEHAKREEWIKVVQKDRAEDTWLPSKFSYVCSAHFKANDFYLTKTGRRFLNKSAVPCSNPSEYSDECRSPNSLDDVQISDSESIFNTPLEIKLKEDLRKAISAKQNMSKKIIKLKRQNKRLKQNNDKLVAIVKQLKEKFGINSQIEIELVKVEKMN